MEIDHVYAREIFDYLVAWCEGSERAFDDLLGKKPTMRKVYGDIRTGVLGLDDFEKLLNAALRRGFLDPNCPDAIKTSKGRNLENEKELD